MKNDKFKDKQVCVIAKGGNAKFSMDVRLAKAEAYACVSGSGESDRYRNEFQDGLSTHVFILTNFVLDKMDK